jgi:predicted MFS family arabinose efflux permease
MHSPQVITDSTYTLFEINQVSLRQAVTPEPLRGRVNATLEFVRLGATLLGALLGGWLGARLGLRVTLWIGASGSVLAALWLGLSPVRRVREITDCEGER